ncbi:MAG TPA: hypothetical protein VFV99_06020 [Kofleriaceae bacterium]|nr:hypothetical protein [Kofleriaceae bacterium]
MDALDARLDRLETRLAASDRFADQQAEKQSDGFARVHSKFDESEERAKARSARIEARLDAIDGRLTTLTATVALHDLQLREAK